MTIVERQRTEPAGLSAPANGRPVDGADIPSSPLNGWSGAVASALVALAFVVPGMLPPRMDQSTADVLRQLEAHRLQVLTTVLMYSAAGIAFMWFCAYLVKEFGMGRSKTSTYAAVFGAVWASAMLAIGQIVIYGVPMSMGHVDESGPGAARMFVTIGSQIMGSGKWGMGLFAFGAAMAAYMHGVISKRNLTLAVITATALLLGSIGPMFVTTGIWQYGGVIEVTTTVPVAFWIIGFGWILARRAGRQRSLAVHLDQG